MVRKQLYISEEHERALKAKARDQPLPGGYAVDRDEVYEDHA